MATPNQSGTAVERWAPRRELRDGKRKGWVLCPWADPRCAAFWKRWRAHCLRVGRPLAYVIPGTERRNPSGSLYVVVPPGHTLPEGVQEKVRRFLRPGLHPHRRHLLEVDEGRVSAPMTDLQTAADLVGQVLDMVLDGMASCSERRL
jgi:hypothetical protein